MHSAAGGAGGGPPPGSFSSAQKSKFPLIKHMKNPREIILHRSSSDSATLIADNQELLLRILHCLPPKSLIRFQVVSKKWLSIISSPDFRRLHCRKYPSTAASSTAASALFLFRKIGGIRELNFISLDQEYVNSMGGIFSRLTNFVNGEILGLHSCNGLLCIEFNMNYSAREFIVFNPTTNQHRVIPLVKPANKLSYVHPYVNIAFDPSKSDHYKLVCAWGDSDRPKFRFLVYSSETGIWREMVKTLCIVESWSDKLSIFTEPYHFDRGVLWNGDLHWVCKTGDDTICFDLDNECVKPEMPDLPWSNGWHEVCYFGESGGELYVIGLNNPQTLLFNVFSLKRDYSQWVVKSYIDLTPLVTLYPAMVDDRYDPADEKMCDFHMPYFLVDEANKKRRLVISLDGKVISYSIDDMTVKEIAEVEPGLLFCSLRDATKYRWSEGCQHVETLACV
nr:F-box protein At5g07610-like [Coffea arabica]